jgi:hypothetical protein
VTRQRTPQSDSPFTRRQQLINLGISLAVAFIVMAATQNAIYGFVTFVLLGIVVNAVMLASMRRGSRARGPGKK